jgi:hypothetical protein
LSAESFFRISTKKRGCFALSPFFLPLLVALTGVLAGVTLAGAAFLSQVGLPV